MTDEAVQDRRADLAFAIGGLNHFSFDAASGLIAGGPLLRRLLGQPDAGDRFSRERLLEKLDGRTGRQLAGILADLARHDDVDVELVAAGHATIDAMRLVGRTMSRPTPILVGVMVDETERRRKEERLRRRAAELAAANRQLGEFIRIVSHDLKSPLRVVHHLTSFLQQDLAKAASPQVPEHLDKLHRQVTRMSRMLDDLQAYARLDRTEGMIVNVDLEALVVELAELVGLPKSLALDVDVAPVRVVTDRVALSLVLRNLIDNVRKHHDRDSGTLRIEARSQGKGWLSIRVADDGPGIAPRYRMHLFEPSDSVGGTEPGSGMGLALVKRAVKRQGGRIWTEEGHTNGADRGAAFCFTWPLARRCRPAG